MASPASSSLKLKVKNLHSLTRKVKSAPVSKSRSEYNVVYKEREFPLPEQSKLREEANKNKSNRDGENFDKNYSVQLHSPDNKCWDLSTIVSSNAESIKLSTRINSHDADSIVDQPNVVRKLDFDDEDDIAETEVNEFENLKDPECDKLSNCLDSNHDNSVFEQSNVVRKLDFDVKGDEIKENVDKKKEVSESEELNKVVTETSNENILLNNKGSFEIQSVKTEPSVALSPKSSAT